MAAQMFRDLVWEVDAAGLAVQILLDNTCGLPTVAYLGASGVQGIATICVNL